MRVLLTRVFALASLMLLAGGGASAYYYYIHFDASGNALPSKWDLTKLPNNTVYFYVADNGLDTAHLTPGDGFDALVSELRAAADVWNTISTSSIRIAYGGLFHSDGTDNNTGINVDFSDAIPDGLLAQSGVTTIANPAAGATFLPILRTQLLFPRLPYGYYGPGYPLASWSELFFTTAVHEFGHNLGLQHTTTSAAMSTYVTSGVSKAKPLAADDIAGISALYPTESFAAQSGTITGKVTFTNGTPVNLAAVVAVPAAGGAISAMTRPDGTYEIDGLPTGVYYIYAQSLPPALLGESSNLGLVYPLAADGATVLGPSCTGQVASPDCYFETTFFPGTSNWRLATPVSVIAGASQNAIDLRVPPRNWMSMGSVRSYGFVSGGIAVGAPPILKGGPRQSLIVVGPKASLLDPETNQFEPGVTFDGLGWIFQVVPNTARPYPPPNPIWYAAVDVTASYFGPNGPRHLVINSADNVYVLPAAVQAVSGPAPSVTSVTPVGDGTLYINGSNLSVDTRVVFDGAVAVTPTVVNSHQLIVTPPLAKPGYSAHVVALDSDGQSSLYISGDSGVPTWTWPGAAVPSLAVTSGVLPAGQSMVVDVIGTNTNFVDGQTVVGFGGSNATVTNVDVLGPGHLQATVIAASGTAIPTTEINVTTGLTVISKHLGYSVTGM